MRTEWVLLLGNSCVETGKMEWISIYIRNTMHIPCVFTFIKVKCSTQWFLSDQLFYPRCPKDRPQNGKHYSLPLLYGALPATSLLIGQPEQHRLSGSVRYSPCYRNWHRPNERRRERTARTAATGPACPFLAAWLMQSDVRQTGVVRPLWMSGHKWNEWLGCSCRRISGRAISRHINLCYDCAIKHALCSSPGMMKKNTMIQEFQVPYLIIVSVLRHRQNH